MEVKVGVGNVLSVATKGRCWEGTCPRECSQAARTFPLLFPLCLYIYYILFLILDSNMTHVFQDTQSTLNLMIPESGIPVKFVIKKQRLVSPPDNFPQRRHKTLEITWPLEWHLKLLHL